MSDIDSKKSSIDNKELQIKTLKEPALEPINEDTGVGDLKRGLEHRHLQLIGIGSSVGTG